MKQYTECVAALESFGLTRRQIAAMIGIDEAVISRRMSGKQTPTREALITVNTLLEVFEGVYSKKPCRIDGINRKGWLVEKYSQARTARGRRAA